MLGILAFICTFGAMVASSNGQGAITTIWVVILTLIGGWIYGCIVGILCIINLVRTVNRNDK